MTGNGTMIPPQGGSGTAIPQTAPVGNANTEAYERHLERIDDMVANALTSRQEWLMRQLDNRRNVFRECNFPENPGARDYQTLFDRDSLAARVVEVFPKESWQTQPTVYENEDGDTPTAFEEAWDALGKSIRGEQSWYLEEEGNCVNAELQQLDVLAGIGHYGILLIGFNDGRPLNEPLQGLDEQGSFAVGYKKDDKGSTTPVGNMWTKGQPRYKATWNKLVKLPDPTPRYPQYNVDPLNPVTGYDEAGNALLIEDDTQDQADEELQVIYLRAFPESQAMVTRWETNPSSPRVRQPVAYLVTMDDSSQLEAFGLSSGATLEVHWSRVIHLADTYHQASSGRTTAPPRLKPVLNDVLSAQKIAAADGEGCWRSGLPGLAFETHPNMGTNVRIDRAAAKDNMENFQESMTKTLLGIGGAYKTLTPTMTDFTPHQAMQIERICIKLGIPVRVFKGSERGELASSQDDSAWNDRLRHRQNTFITPKIIVPFVDRLIACGVLPEPAEGYKVYWESVDSQTPLDKANVANIVATAMATYLAGGIDTMVAPFDFLTRVLNYEEDEAQAILDSAEKEQVKKEADNQALADEHGMIPAPPEGFVDPKQQEKEHQMELEKIDAKVSATAKAQAKPNPFAKK